MFVKLNDFTILDMSTGTCYTMNVYSESGVKRHELIITFNGPQTDKVCSGSIADRFWSWLNKAAMKFDEQPEEILEDLSNPPF